MKTATMVSIAAICFAPLIPTAAASDPPTGTRVDDDCVVLWNFPDEGLAVCGGREECVGGLYTRRTTFIGTEERCIA